MTDRLTYEAVSGFFCGMASAVSRLDSRYEPLTGVPGSGVMRVVNSSGTIVAQVARSVLTSTGVIEQWFQYEVYPHLKPIVTESTPAPEPDVLPEEDVDDMSEAEGTEAEDDISDLL